MFSPSLLNNYATEWVYSKMDGMDQFVCLHSARNRLLWAQRTTIHSVLIIIIIVHHEWGQNSTGPKKPYPLLIHIADNLNQHHQHQPCSGWW